MILRQLCKEQRGVVERSGDHVAPLISAHVRHFSNHSKATIAPI